MLLDEETTWPLNVVDCLRESEEVFDDWYGPASHERERHRRVGEEGIAHAFGAREHDRAIVALEVILRQHTLERGHHCTRLTDSEIDEIRRTGMRLPDGDMLRSRIAALEHAGVIARETTARLSRENQADQTNRAGRIWFCFHVPHLAGQRGIERLFLSWGGEALYNSHEQDPITGPILHGIGVPCVVVADVPIASLRPHSSLSVKIIRRYFVHRGAIMTESIDHEDCAVHPLPASSIREIIRFSDPDFAKLTRCDRWDPPLT